MAIDRHGPHRWELRLQSGALEAVQLNRLVEVAQSEATDRRELDVGDVPRLGGDDLGGEHLTTVRRVGHPSRLVNRQGDVVAIAGDATPAWIPIRTRGRPSGGQLAAARRRWASAQARSADEGSPKAARHESPRSLTGVPPWSVHECRSTALCRSMSSS